MIYIYISCWFLDCFSFHDKVSRGWSMVTLRPWENLMINQIGLCFTREAIVLGWYLSIPRQIQYASKYIIYIYLYIDVFNCNCKCNCNYIYRHHTSKYITHIYIYTNHLIYKYITNDIHIYNAYGS